MTDRYRFHPRTTLGWQLFRRTCSDV